MAYGLTVFHVQAGADANLTNNVGDTPLHKAAFTGRQVHYINIILIIGILKLCLWILHKMSLLYLKVYVCSVDECKLFQKKILVKMNLSFRISALGPITY